MAKNVTIANVDYSNVPSIEVPLTAGGGNAKFVEISATTATADKILTGYGAYSSSGVWMDGMATGGGGSGAVIQDQDGYVVLDDEEGAQITVEPLSVTQNGTYTAPTNKAYSPVTVNVNSAFTLVGTYTAELEEYTDTTTVQNIDTGINIKNTNYAWGIVVISCDSPVTTSTEWGMTVQLWGRYKSNSAMYDNASAGYWQKGSSTLDLSAMTNNTNGGNGSYGVGLNNNTGTVVFFRKAHATACPKIRAGTYTVKVYALTSL